MLSMNKVINLTRIIINIYTYYYIIYIAHILASLYMFISLKQVGR